MQVESWKQTDNSNAKQLSFESSQFRIQSPEGKINEQLILKWPAPYAVQQLCG